MIYQKLIDEYPPEYCLFLEATYSKGMMAEGGIEAVEAMLKGVELQRKTIVDIGSGLGGLALYVAEQYKANVIGVEINPWLIEEATRRIPEPLKHQLSYITYDQPSHLPLDSKSVDMVVSRGVLVHVEDKLPLFKDIFRVLKPNGEFIIDDWLSPQEDTWGKNIQAMCEIENLTLYPTTIDQYKKVMQDSGFDDLIIKDINTEYAGYNQAIVDRLTSPDHSKAFIEAFGASAHQDAIKGYQLITQSMLNQEVLVRNIRSIRKI